MSDIERLEACAVCGRITSETVVMPDDRMRYYCLRHLPQNVRPATDAEAAAVRLTAVSEQLWPDAYVSREDAEQMVTELRAALAAERARAEDFRAELEETQCRVTELAMLNEDMQANCNLLERRAEAAEAKLARVDEYAGYYRDAENGYQCGDETAPLDFAEWLAQQSEAHL